MGRKNGQASPWKAVGRKLLAWRKGQIDGGKPLSQRAIAHRVGCSQAMFAALEAGEKQPGIDFAMAIERETGGVVSVSDWQSVARVATTKTVAKRSVLREVRS